MPRIRKAVLQQELQLGLSDLIGVSKPKGKRSPPKVSNYDEEVARMRFSNNWQGAGPMHMVALYCWCHEQVYGVAPAELLATGKSSTAARKGAAGSAARMLRGEFDDKPDAMAGYINWVFKREVGREKWAKENQRDRGRITWQTIFASRSVLTDWRTDRLRKRA